MNAISVPMALIALFMESGTVLVLIVKEPGSFLSAIYPLSASS